MAVFLGDERAGLKLDILGYEFPDGDLGYYDNNWLVVKLTAWTPDGAWECTRPMLDTRDPGLIASWLTATSQGQRVNEWLRFTEPNLYFRFVEYRGESAVIDVYFELEARAPWDQEPKSDNDYDGRHEDEIAFVPNPPPNDGPKLGPSRGPVLGVAQPSLPAHASADQVGPTMTLTIDRAQIDQADRDLQAAALQWPEREGSPDWPQLED